MRVCPEIQVLFGRELNFDGEVFMIQKNGYYMRIGSVRKLKEMEHVQ